MVKGGKNEKGERDTGIYIMQNTMVKGVGGMAAGEKDEDLGGEM